MSSPAVVRSPEPALTDVVEARGLTKAYGSLRALDDCTLGVPRGRVSALVGPNGAGKTTLLHLLAGLASPTSGEALVFGRDPRAETDVLADVGFVAQDAPLYRRFSAEDHIGIGAHLNRRWDSGIVRSRLADHGIPCDKEIGKLSGGQRAQVALALALAKQPRLLVLDEPVAALDPLARRQFLRSLAQAMAESDLTVVMSSHLLGDLERVCDHLVLLSSSRVQLCGDIEGILEDHKLLVGPGSNQLGALRARHTVVQATQTPRQTSVLVRLEGEALHDPRWEAHDTDLEELVLGYMGMDAAEQSKLRISAAADGSRWSLDDERGSGR